MKIEIYLVHVWNFNRLKQIHLTMYSGEFITNSDQPKQSRRAPNVYQIFRKRHRSLFEKGADYNKKCIGWWNKMDDARKQEYVRFAEELEHHCNSSVPILSKYIEFPQHLQPKISFVVNIRWRPIQSANTNIWRAHGWVKWRKFKPRWKFGRQEKPHRFRDKVRLIRSNMISHFIFIYLNKLRFHPNKLVLAVLLLSLLYAFLTSAFAVCVLACIAFCLLTIASCVMRNYFTFSSYK